MAILAIIFSSCSKDGSDEKSIDTVGLTSDQHSYANMDEVIIEHIHLDLKADFSSKTLSGFADLSIKNLKESESLILDTRLLSVQSVELDQKIETSFKMGKTDDVFGTAMNIAIKPETKKVRIYYSTDPKAPALQWLEPKQTFGKKHPFLFSQSQAILARSWIPCQDAPGVKFTYSAKITTDPDLLAVMSAENGTQKNADGVYTFKMEQPISSYLLALGIGDLAYKSTGRNSGVYAEPSMLEKSVWEFAQMQSMIDSAEQLYGEYRWEQYDVLVLPSSFPFGGMENPRLTFATPTILAGDRSLVALIAHELAHSWSGNLVTNETWNDFWLNEGFTVYFEQRIMEKIYGIPYSRMQTKLGLGELQHTVKHLSEEGKKEDTHLYLDLENRNPDDGLTDVAYEKGRFLLQTIETTVGRDRFDAFLKEYFNKNAFKAMNTATFIETLNNELLSKEEADKINLDAWIYGPGIPENIPNTDSKELVKVEAEIKAFNDGSKMASQLSAKGWTTHHYLYFLRGLTDLNIDKMTALDKRFNFTETGNSEIACDWFKHSIEQNYEYAFPAIESFLIRVGRRKFLTPLYERLAKTKDNKEWAKKVYAKARPGYHSVSYNTIDEILK